MVNIAGRTCAWCTRPMPHTARRDAVTCSKKCRQARHRFVRAIVPTGPWPADEPAGTSSSTSSPSSSSSSPRRLAYADPPYPDLAGRYYADHPDFGGEVDHAQLVEQLAGFDGWALSTSARALPDVLRICPPGVRVAAWHRGAAAYARSPYALNAWEPVIYVPVPAHDVSCRDLAEPSRPAEADLSRRPRAQASRLAIVDPSPAPASYDGSVPGRRDTLAPSEGDGLGAAEHDTSAVVVHDGSTPAFHDASLEVLHDGSAEDLRDVSPLEVRTDSLVYGSRPRLTDPARVTGAKPAVFVRWLFELLGADPADELTDLFPGSGGIGRAWQIYTGASSRADLQ